MDRKNLFNFFILEIPKWMLVVIAIGCLSGVFSACIGVISVVKRCRTRKRQNISKHSGLTVLIIF